MPCFWAPSVWRFRRCSHSVVLDTFYISDKKCYCQHFFCKLFKKMLLFRNIYVMLYADPANNF